MPDSTASPPRTQASVYRYYDGDGLLIYVGLTKRGPKRNLEHAGDKKWWPFVVSQEVEHFHTVEAATMAERMLIQTHRPPFNKQHNPEHGAMQEAYLGMHGDVEVSGWDGRSCDPYREMENAMGRRLPLELVYESHYGKSFTFRTKPEHYMASRILEINKRVHVFNTDGKFCGVLSQIAQSGLIAYVRGKLKDPALLDSVAAEATFKIIHAHKRLALRLTSVRLLDSAALS